jgi:hypothetical protein
MMLEENVLLECVRHLVDSCTSPLLKVCPNTVDRLSIDEVNLFCQGCPASQLCLGTFREQYNSPKLNGRGTQVIKKRPP